VRDDLDEKARVAFGMRLRELRLSAGLSQEELASRAGLDRTYISSCERGRRNLSLTSIFRIALGLKIAPAELLKFDSTTPRWTSHATE